MNNNVIKVIYEDCHCAYKLGKEAWETKGKKRGWRGFQGYHDRAILSCEVSIPSSLLRVTHANYRVNSFHD